MGPWRGLRQGETTSGALGLRGPVRFGRRSLSPDRPTGAAGQGLRIGNREGSIDPIAGVVAVRLPTGDRGPGAAPTGGGTTAV
jgi:hypothetical protein